MISSRFGLKRFLLTLLVFAGVSFACTQTLYSQTTTGMIRGTVTVAGEAAANAQVQVRNPQTGVSRGATVHDDGSYVVAGLPPATYEMTVRRIGSEPQTRTVVVLIGATQSQNFNLSAAVTQLGTVFVQAAATAETQTSEVATNVTQQQINNLPTPGRNMLDLAALAPGTRVAPDRLDGTSKTFAAGAQRSDQINVFVDGASYKNDIIQGGVAGQDASRGNPFPRNALQEFRITTSNFKAEYQKSSSAIITAVTKSGTNEWQANAFTEFLNESFVALDTFSRAAKNTNPNFKKPDFKRYLAGISAGGPIVKDKVFFFGSYEGNIQDREGTTRFNGNPANWPAGLAAINGEQHVSPFRSHLGFAKVTYNPSERQSFEFTGDIRRESDERRFGGQFTGPEEARSTGEDFKSNVATGRIKHSLFGSGWTNEALASYQSFRWQTVPFNPDLPFLQYNGIGNIGGRDASQDLSQGRLSLRDDFTYTEWQAAGSHVLKTGVNFDHLNYDLTKRLVENPRFVFDSRNNFAFPVEARIGAGDPSVKNTNNQVGLYAQDDWTPIERLIINAGVRWDYESGMYNRKFAMRQATMDSLTAYRNQLFIDIDPDRYFTDGNDRKAFYGAIQPRLGASYGIDKDSRTVLFGGWGIFYDRLTFNSTIDEAYNAQHPTYNFRFDTADIAAQNVVKWNPSYFSQAGLLGLLSRGVVPPGEIFLMPNNLKPPKSNQWNVGARHDFGAWNTALTYTGTRSDNGFTFEWANHKLNANGTCCEFHDFLVPSYRNVLVGRNNVRTWYDALFLQIDRPYRATSGWNWGAGLAWTYTIKAEAEGGDLFSFPVVENQPRRPLDDFERHHIVANMITDVPYAWGIQFSSLITLGTGRRFNSQDFSGPIPIVDRGVTDPQKFGFIIPKAFAFRNVDVRLRKDFVKAAGNKLGVTFDVFNVFNFNNYGCFNDVFATNDNGTRKLNADYGKPGCIIADPRRAQLGLSYDFQPRRM